MPRFHFHARVSNRNALDREGIELDDVPTARAIALLAAVEALDDMDDLEDHLDCRFEVTDDAGQVIVTIPFSECALAWDGRHRRVVAGRARPERSPLRNAARR